MVICLFFNHKLFVSTISAEMILSWNDSFSPANLICCGPDAPDKQNCTPSYHGSIFLCDGEETELPMSYVCDYIHQCRDSSDEENCPHLEYFTCANGRETIRLSYTCDQEFDCSDESDEHGCGN